ncbi:MAG: 3'-5' exonuclease [Chlamydiales bacterium]|nr:3'-5' exonuclease [Chlamydiales bacterium]
MIGIFLDTETNGLDFYKHCVLEIAFKFVNLSTGSPLFSYDSVIFHSIETWKKSNPISLQINGITWEMIEKGSTTDTVSKAIIDSFSHHHIKRGKAVFICQNPSFDRIFFSQLVHPDIQEKLQWPYHWLDLASMHWALSIQQHKNHQGLLPWEVGLSKDHIANYHHIPPEARPHRAMNGVNHLISCYEHVVGFLV